LSNSSRSFIVSRHGLFVEISIATGLRRTYLIVIGEAHGSPRCRALQLRARTRMTPLGLRGFNTRSRHPCIEHTRAPSSRTAPKVRPSRSHLPKSMLPSSLTPRPNRPRMASGENEATLPSRGIHAAGRVRLFRAGTGFCPMQPLADVDLASTRVKGQLPGARLAYRFRPGAAAP